MNPRDIPLRGGSPADLPRASFISYLTAPAINTDKRMDGI